MLTSSRVLRVGLVLLLGAFCGFNIFFSSGIVGVTEKPNHIFSIPGCFCHGDSTSPGVRVWIAGPDSLDAGTEALYTISVAKDTSIAAGFNVASFFGSLGIVDSAATQLIPGGDDTLELTHTQPRLANSRDTISWEFRYRAPLTAGMIDTLYANGNSVDLSFEPSGDHWNFAENLLVHVTGTSSVRGEPTIVQSYRLHQNYPNPFNPTTAIGFQIAERGHVSLMVYDALGREVATLVDEQLAPGAYTREWNAARFASGVYICRLSGIPSNGGGRFIETNKMVLLR